jgi:hypothetical protein
MSEGWHLAQYNLAKLRKPLTDPLLADFVSEIDRVNHLGDASPGFVWRHQTEEGNSTSVRPRDDDSIIINFTVWESVDALFEFTYHSDHVEVYRKRRKWFEHVDWQYLVLWWVPAGHIPTVEEAEERLLHLNARGPTPHAFTFKQRFPAPIDQAAQNIGT